MDGRFARFSPVSRRFVLGLALLLPFWGAKPALTGEEPGQTGVVAEVRDGDTLSLGDGRVVRLVGLQAPKLSLGRPGFTPWPLAEDAKKALEALTLSRRVRLVFGPLKSSRHQDRHGRWLARLYLDDGREVQREMIAQGWARVYSFADNRDGVAALLADEEAARAGGKGIWAEAFYRPRGSNEAGECIGTFQLVEGVVHDVAERKSATYVNFGEDWRSDFTIAIPRRAAKSFRQAGIAPAEWKGRRLRVRGWVREKNGPLIEVTHPEQVELLANIDHEKENGKEQKKEK